MRGANTLLALNEGMPGSPAGQETPVLAIGRPDTAPADIAGGWGEMAGQLAERADRHQAAEEAKAKRLWTLTTAADVEATADRLAVEHEADPEAYQRVYAAAVKPYLDSAPDDETRQVMEAEAKRYGTKQTTRLMAQSMERANAAVEADLLVAREEAENRYLNALRAGDYAMGADETGAPVMTGAAAEYLQRAEALDEHHLDLGATPLQVANARRQRQARATENIVLGEFERELARGYGAARSYMTAAATDTETILDPDQRQSLANVMQARLNQRLAESDRAERNAERFAKSRRDAVVREAALRRLDGTLNDAFIREHAADLDGADIAKIDGWRRSDLKDDDAVVVNKDVYVDLLTRANGGDDITEAATTAWVNNDLKEAQMKYLIGVSESRREAAVDEGVRLINTEMPTDVFNPKAGAPTRRANALQDYRSDVERLKKAGKTVTPGETSALARYHAARYAFADSSNSLLTVPLPTTMASRSPETFDYAAEAEKIRARALADPGYAESIAARDLRDLERLNQVITEQREAAAAMKAARP